MVVLHTNLTDELVDEGIFREVLSRVQAARKDAQLEYTDRITISVDGSERVVRVAKAWESDLRKDMLSTVIQSFLQPDNEQVDGGRGGEGLDTERANPEDGLSRCLARLGKMILISSGIT